MSEVSNIKNSLSLFIINFAIKITKLSIFLCLVYFSYFYLNTTEEGKLIIKNVEQNYEIGKNYLAERIKLFNGTEIVDDRIIIREVKPETLSKLSNEETVALGVVKLPYGFQVQDEYKGIKFVRSPKKAYSDLQLKLLKYFIDNAPQKLLTPGPDAVVIFEADEIDYEDFTIMNPSTLAFSSGTYIFLTNTSFEGTNTSLKTIDEAMQTFFHELMHVSQFNYELENLTQQSIYELTLDGKDWTDLISVSELTKSFQGVTEWQYNEQSREYTLDNPETVLTTKYGSTSIYEDIAESVSGTITSQIHNFSDNRVKWALFFLESDYNNLIFHMFPHNDQLEPIRQDKPRLNFEKEEEFKKNYNITDRQYFITTKQYMIQSISDYFMQELPKRGFIGNLKLSTDKNGVEKFTGEFKSDVRTLYIELESFDKARGYSVKPQGTIVNIINGYNLSKY